MRARLVFPSGKNFQRLAKQQLFQQNFTVGNQAGQPTYKRPQGFGLSTLRSIATEDGRQSSAAFVPKAPSRHSGALARREGGRAGALQDADANFFIRVYPCLSVSIRGLTFLIFSAKQQPQAVHHHDDGAAFVADHADGQRDFSKHRKGHQHGDGAQRNHQVLPDDGPRAPA
jgi:hypothetical protein